MSDDQQSVAESIDPDELGDDPAGDLDFPPDRPLGVDDPTRDDRNVDDVAARAAREEPEQEVGGEEIRLSAPNDVLDDDVAEAVATAEPADDLTAEEAAVHIVDDPDAALD